MLRYIQHSGQPSTNLGTAAEDISAALALAFSRCINQTQYFSGTVYVGLAGYALMKNYLSFLSLSYQDSNINLSSNAQDLYSASDHDIAVVLESTPERAWEAHNAAHISFLETNVGVAAFALCRILESSQDLLKHWERCVQLLQRALEHVHVAAQGVGEDDDGCEVLYGRAGFLYALLQVRKSVIRARGGSGPALPPQLLESVDALVAQNSIRAVISDIVRCGEVGARRYAAELVSTGSAGDITSPPLMWSWHGTRYLGAAHGVAGILQVLWGCPGDVIAPYISRMLETVQWLVGCQDSIGNWPTQAPTSIHDKENELVQWCHGAPGMIILLSTILQRSRTHPAQALDPALHQMLTTSLHAAAQLVYRHGFLRKGLGLCHGVAGSVYALLAASDALDYDSDSSQPRGADTDPGGKMDNEGAHLVTGPQEQYLRRAIHLAHLATDHTSLVARGEMGVPDRPLSLYEGLAGMCCAWAVILCRLTRMQRGSSPAGGDVGAATLRIGMPGYDDLRWGNAV